MYSEAVSLDWVPIEKQTVTTMLDHKINITCRRTQFPVVQASSITIHKSYGSMYATGVVYDYHKLHPQKLVYVALSRATSIDGLYITNADDDFTFYHGAGNPDRLLRDELNRLRHHRLDTIVQRFLQYSISLNDLPSARSTCIHLLHIGMTSCTTTS